VKKHSFQVFAMLLTMTILIVLLAGCEMAPTDTRSSGTSSKPGEIDAYSQATLNRFRTGEIREFQGNFLSPAVGPRDNSIKGVQRVDIQSYTLRIDGLVDQPVTFMYEEAKAFPAHERLITLYCVEGWNATILWQGVRMADMLGKAGVRTEAVTVIFHSVDGYTTSLPLATIMEKDLILAYMANGLPLPPEMGFPFIFVAEDKLGYKWARWVNRIELSADKNYRGYWEGFGYSNSADLP